MQHFHFSLVAQITEFQVPKPETQNQACNMFIVHLNYTNHWVPSSEGRNPNPETRKYVHNMSIFHSLHKSPSFECWNPKLETRRATCWFFIYMTQIIEFRGPRSETRTPRPENMCTTCPFFTCCTNHRVLSAETWNSKPGMQHVHFSFILHKSSSSECRGPKPEPRDPKICMQHFHFSLVAQITEFQVPKPETQNRVCNMSIVQLYYTSH
jgi:hypothetical protein